MICEPLTRKTANSEAAAEETELENYHIHFFRCQNEQLIDEKVCLTVNIYE